MLNKKSFKSSNEPMSLDYQEVNLALKSLSMTENDGLRAFMSDRRCSKFVKKLSN